MTGEIRIYVEGGGTEPHQQRQLRIGFDIFLGEVKSLARKNNVDWKLITCGGINAAYKRFINAIVDYPEAIVFLLVDSDQGVSKSPQEHLAESHVEWNLDVAQDNRIHLMVQAMEAWFVADTRALERFYGDGFNIESIPDDNVESIPKNRLEIILRAATRDSAKGKYHKMQHGPKILAYLSPALVRDASLHCERLFTCLEQILRDV